MTRRLLLAGWVVIPRDHWYVKPAEDGKWRECLESHRWNGVTIGCGGPMSLDNEPQTCTICGKKALFKVNNLGFCKKHELQAIAYKKQFPVERTGWRDKEQGKQ